MKIISTGGTYKIVDDSLKVYDSLPVRVYSIDFSPMNGFSLSNYDDIEINEKIYGEHIKKKDKVLRGFKRADRNFGVILSGDKGTGKSLFAKLLIEDGIKTGYPVIIVDRFIPGISSFINDIQQEVIVLFDEYDKTFSSGYGEDSSTKDDPQTEMLSLFDGIGTGKKLFVITCNKLNKLNDYIVNRPGRFHYHFRFDYPEPAEIQEYLLDHGVADEKEIKKVVSFAAKVPLNFDCLRAISFELVDGSNFEEAINDLNILNLAKERYDVTLHFKDGRKIIRHGVRLNLFDNIEMTSIYFEYPECECRDLGSVDFLPSDIDYDMSTFQNIITAKNFSWTMCDEKPATWDSPEEKAAYQAWKNAEPTHMIFKKEFDNSYRYIS